jgi:hypothetical protein
MDLTIDHIVPRAELGPSDSSNLALACLSCNARKWKFDRAVDPHSGHRVPLFHPRQHRWHDHLKWNTGDPTRIEGRTATGRATVELLQMNSRRAIQIRRWLMLIGLHPPRAEE